jgi:hypothetical protein
VKGVVSDEDVKGGKVRIIAPEGMIAEAISENVMAGNAMARRSTYMFGSILSKGPEGQVDAGMGKTTSSGTVSFIPPTDEITKPVQEMLIDGIRFVFQQVPQNEAPAEMNFYLPDLKTLRPACITFSPLVAPRYGMGEPGRSLLTRRLIFLEAMRRCSSPLITGRAGGKKILSTSGCGSSALERHILGDGGVYHVPVGRILGAGSGWCLSDRLGGGAAGLQTALMIAAMPGILGAIYFWMSSRHYPADCVKVAGYKIEAEK